MFEGFEGLFKATQNELHRKNKDADAGKVDITTWTEARSLLNIDPQKDAQLYASEVKNNQNAHLQEGS